MIKRLAKLRQFTQGMDVEKFLVSEFRQNMLAIEATINGRVATTSATDEPLINNGYTIFWASEQTSTLSGVVSLSDSVIATSAGSVVSNVFYPSMTGTYFVKFGFSSNLVTNLTNSATLSCFFSDNSLAGIARMEFCANFSSPIGESSAVNGIFMDLSGVLGVYFSVSSSNITSNRFFCEISKVS
jgi:hypothetical protein